MKLYLAESYSVILQVFLSKLTVYLVPSFICKLRNKLIQLVMDKEFFNLINNFIISNKLGFKREIIIHVSIIKSSGNPRKTSHLSKNRPLIMYSRGFDDK